MADGAASRRPALVVDDHRRRRRTTRVVLIDPHRRALLVEGRNPDDEQLTWMMVGSGIEDGENPAAAAARQVLKVTGRRGLPRWHRTILVCRWPVRAGKRM
ncbi:NUDIX domain-containing protein [Mycobacterium tuberculosis]|uniref:NUDIX domain-containing protein n=1 Tax=Mycobacterium tuberculosis TaxID=1773 RepID=UPI001BDE1AF1